MTTEKNAVLIYVLTNRFGFDYALVMKSTRTEKFSHETWKNPQSHGGCCRFASKRYAFVRFNNKWEFYSIIQSGPSRGLEMFSGYVEKPEQIERLNRAAEYAWLSQSLPSRIHPALAWSGMQQPRYVAEELTSRKAG
jgi:hypothetical protein